MKVNKLLVTAAVAAAALIPGIASNAQRLRLAGVGSSAQFNAFLSAVNAASSTPNVKFYVTGSNSSISASPNGDTGQLFIAVTGGNNTTTLPSTAVVDFYLQTDSTVGNRAYFNGDTLTLPATLPTASTTIAAQFNGSVPSTRFVAATDNDIVAAAAYIRTGLVKNTDGTTNFTIGGATVPANRFNTGLTDITPADAVVATAKALDQGYGTNTTAANANDPGAAVFGFNSGGASSTASNFKVVSFSFSTRPFTSGSTAGTQLISVGAAPVIVVVNASNTGSGHFGDSNLTDINRFVLAGFLDGTFTRTRDAFNNVAATSSNNFPVTVYIRELLSGTYNTMEYCIPASAEVGSSQDGFRQTNPLNEPTDNGAGRGRVRAIGTGASIALANGSTSTGAPLVANASQDAMTYAFFSPINFVTSGPGLNANNLKYLTVDGVDPLVSTYSNGSLAVSPTFANVANGRYPIWSLLRAVTDTRYPNYTSSDTTAPTLNNLVTAAQGLGTGFFLAPNSLFVFRSHRDAVGQAANNGLPGEGVEAGADAGGAIYTIQAENDFRADTGGGQLVNARQ